MTARHSRAEVDEARCVGTGDCARIAPQAFAIDEGAATAQVRSTAWDAAEDDLVDAAMNCPTQAIRVFARDGRPLL